MVLKLLLSINLKCCPPRRLGIHNMLGYEQASQLLIYSDSCTLGVMFMHLTKMTMPNKDDSFLARKVQYCTAVFK